MGGHAGAQYVSTLVAKPRAAAGRVLRRAVWDSFGLPSGPSPSTPEGRHSGGWR